MLGFMRKNARSPWIKTIFILIIGVFLFWGVGIMVGGDRVNVAAIVDGEPITAQAYTRAYENMQRMYQQIYRENFNPRMLAELNLQQRALDDLVTEMLLRREAVRLGLQVTDDEVRDAILDIPTFRDAGRFDRTRYLAALRQSRLSPAEFEESQRESLLITKLESLLTDGLYVSERELRDLFVVENEKINVVFVKLPYKKFEEGVTVTDDEVAAYYEKYTERFREPERVSVTWIPYEPAGFEAKVATPDDEIKAYYDTHASEFETPEKIRVRHILFTVPADASDAARAEIRTKAEGVLAEVKGGGDFAALARTHSGDPLSAEAGGDLGLVERGKLEAPLEEAAFALESGGVSELVETTRGLSIAKVDEKQPAGVRPLPEVREQIVRALQQAGADQAARDALAADLTKAREGTSLEDLAAARGVKATTSPPASRAQRIPGVRGPEMLTAAFALEVGAVEEQVATELPYYLFKVVEKVPSVIQPLAEARKLILETLRAEKSKAAAEAAAKEILATVREKGGLAGFTEIAHQKGSPIEETGPFTRAEAIPKLGTAPIKDRLFALTESAPLGTRVEVLEGGAYLLALKERVPPADTEFSEKRDSLRDAALARKRSQILSSYRDSLRQRADITINPDVVTGART